VFESLFFITVLEGEFLTPNLSLALSDSFLI
jgi:hypothetical protein